MFGRHGGSDLDRRRQGSSSGDYELPFGAALRRVRLSAGMSQEQLGLEAGVQRNFISGIETGQNQPTIGTISKLARALSMKASELVAEVEAEVLTRKKVRRPSAS
jgi:transcriptional regulator with XRE-family HTH domain